MCRMMKRRNLSQSAGLDRAATMFGHSRRKCDLRVGGALWEAQLGRKARWAEPLKGFGGAGVIEVVDDFDGDTFRAVYTVRFAGVVYVLHAFQKKSKSGSVTPRHQIALIKQRFTRAGEDYDQWRASTKMKSR